MTDYDRWAADRYHRSAAKVVAMLHDTAERVEHVLAPPEPAPGTGSNAFSACVARALSILHSEIGAAGFDALFEAASMADWAADPSGMVRGGTELL